MDTVIHPERSPGVGGELRALLRLAIPVALSEVGWMTMTVVDTVMVGGLGPRAIGAVGLGNAIYYAPSLFGIGLLLGLDTLVARSWGAGEYDDCHRSLAQGVYIAAAISPLLMLLIFAITPWFSSHGVDPAVARLTRSYLFTLNWGTLPLLVYGAFRRYLQGVGSVKPIAFALISANLVNLAGDWLLIYGRMGAPALGVRGSALSTCFARVYMAAVLIGAARLHERRRGHGLFYHWPRPDWRRLHALFQLGLPASFQIVLEVAAFGTATIFAAHLGPIPLAAHEIALNCAAYTYMVPLGISSAAAVLVGHAMGAGDPQRARRAGWLALALAVCFMASTAVLFLTAARPIIHIYTFDPRVVAAGVPILALAAAFQIFDGMQTVATGALRGVGDTRMPMFANLIGYWIIGLPVGLILCFGFHRGLSGLWSGLTLALVIIAAILVRRLARRWQKPCSIA